MGVTGSGKSSFIALCSGQPVRIGHSLGACTSTVDVYAYDISPDQTVYLIDTPGFDDTNKSDTEVLSEIAAWLGESYKKRVLLNGIIYLHRITDIRMQGSAKKNLLMFRQLCGEDALKKVVLATTMWDKVPTEEGEKREKELVDTQEFWGWMLQKGSSCSRHTNSEDSAKRIVQTLVGHETPAVTTLQVELIDEKLRLDQTSAGRALHTDLLRRRETWTKERQDIKDQLKTAETPPDREAKRLMREECGRYSRMIKMAEVDVANLRASMEHLLVQRERRVARVLKQLKKDRVALNEPLPITEDRPTANKGIPDLEKKSTAELQVDNAYTKHPDLDQETEAEDDDALTAKSDTIYSVGMYGYFYSCLGSSFWSSNSVPPKQTRGHEWLRSVCFGEDYKGVSTWIARYTDGWMKSPNFEKRYSQLNGDIKVRGLDNLDMVALGPSQKYYARWKDGSWTSLASDEANSVFSRCHSKENRSNITAVAFGYGNAYVIAFEYGFRSGRLGCNCSLNGHYPGLAQLFGETRHINITAITLNPENTTDFILIWKKSPEDDRHKISWCSQYGNVQNSIGIWWQNSKVQDIF
ncbi:unnamed protein product [Clonostachys rosea f. rosea IK726]|uniref:Uncharacterized protein n=2 Tax=Bionectria ochroleuca TaxID=29856 RepID=A0A0B7KEZ4_BIOOC|nr:unnamed protein product [Clonostachys rosea f. rosea IK726]